MSKTKYRKQEVPELYNKRLAYTGQLLREYRWGTSKSRQQIEKEFGISQRTVEQIERGRPISMISLYRYASCFGLEPSDLLFRDSEIK
jgi:transcriptional regulator with XRE-family HTH domain